MTESVKTTVETPDGFASWDPSVIEEVRRVRLAEMAIIDFIRQEATRLCRQAIEKSGATA